MKRGEGSGSGASSLLTTLMSVWKLLSGCLCVGVGASGSRLQGSKGAEAKCEIGLYHYILSLWEKEKNRLVINKVLTIIILYRLLRKLDTGVKVIGLRYC